MAAYRHDMTASEEVIIRDVWAHNLEHEMAIIAELIDEFPYVAMDTEFPGVIAHPVGQYPSQENYWYQLMRCNVDYLKIIQIGITLGDGKGNFPTPCCTWQFNFKFNIDEDMYHMPAIELLQQSGIDFNRFNTDGINVFDFTQLLYTSGLIMNEDVTFVTFHSVYDFGYLIKMLICKPLPSDEAEFMRLLDVMIPHYYDLKLIVEDLDESPNCGLEKLSNELGVRRVGPQHQAGSDALVTLKTFTAMVGKWFDGDLQSERHLRYRNMLYGFSDRR